MLLVQLARRLQRCERSFVILGLKCSLADVVVSLRRHRAFWKLLQQLFEGVRHPFGIILLSQDKSLLLERGFALLRGWILGQECVQIPNRRVVILAFLVSERALR